MDFLIAGFSVVREGILQVTSLLWKWLTDMCTSFGWTGSESKGTPALYSLPKSVRKTLFDHIPRTF